MKPKELQIFGDRLKTLYDLGSGFNPQDLMVGMSIPTDFYTLYPYVDIVNKGKINRISDYPPINTRYHLFGKSHKGFNLLIPHLNQPLVFFYYREMQEIIQTIEFLGLDSWEDISYSLLERSGIT